MQFKSIKTRIVVFAGMSFLITSGLIILIAANSMKTIASESKEYALEEAQKRATLTAENYSRNIRLSIEASLNTARTLAHSLSAIKNKNYSFNPSRDDVNSLLKGVLMKNSDFLGIYTAWEPDAFDEKDEEYINTKGHDATGRFIPYWTRKNNQPLIEALVNYDTAGDGDYYIIPKQRKRESIINPFFYNVQGKEVLLTSLVVPVMEGGLFYGIAGIDLSIDFIQKMVKNVQEGRKITIISNQGDIVASTGRSELIKKSATEIYANFLSKKESVLKGENLSVFENGSLITLVPMKIGLTDTSWIVMVSVPEKIITEQADLMSENAQKSIFFLIIVGLICIFFALIILYFIAFKVAKAVKNIAEKLKDIAEGEGDLTVKLPADSKDELGMLAQKFNLFISKLHAMISDISEQTHVLSAASEELQLTNANMSENLHGVSNEIKYTDQISQEVGGKTISTAAAVEQASQNINNISSMSREIKGYYNNLSGNAGALENKVMSVTAAVEEMNATIGEITKNTTEAASISQDANQQAEDTGEMMLQLSKMANDINEIVDMIKEVSAQTNLLALNATIEAASAGEAGKGFAVVANEIKNLANQTADATKNINDQIKGVQKHTNDSVGRIKNIQTVITSLNEINLSIASALEEQSVTISAISEDMTVTASTTRDTVENVHRVGGQITEITENIDQATGNIGLITRDTQEISMSMENITGKISEVSEITIDNLAGVEEMNQSASELAKMAEHLNQIVGMFKL